MKIPRAARRCLLLCVLLALGSCVELSGQRITLFYDADKDRLLFLINYDGIHDNIGRNARVGAEQIPAFIRDGDFMLLDWPGHVQMQSVKQFAGSAADAPGALAALAAAAAKNVRSTAVGHYRDPDGRIGAAQLVAISEAKEFVRRANAALNAAILAATRPDAPPDEAPGADIRMTVARMRPGALQDRQWVAIEGHSLKFEFPAQPAEWTRLKFNAAKKMCERWAELRDQAAPDAENPLLLLQVLTASAAFQESPDGVIVRLGTPARPSTFRFALRDRYEANLEQTVVENVPEPWDAALARSLLNPGEVPPPSTLALREWVPPEEKVRALLGILEADAPKDEALRQAARERLEAIGAAWNREEPFPKAPDSKGAESAYLAGWKTWYRSMLCYPALD